MISKDREVLFSNKLFMSIGESTLNSWLKNGLFEIKSRKKGEAILSKENFSRCLIVILKGSAAVVKTCAEGKRAVINLLRRGEVFGMATLFFEQEEYPSEIIAEEDCRIALFPKELVEMAFAENPDFARSYVTLLSEKIHFLNGKLAAFAENEGSDKLLRWISQISGGRIEFELPCSVSRISEMLGIGRASVYRGFEALTESGILRKNGKNIIIIKPERLIK